MIKEIKNYLYLTIILIFSAIIYNSLILPLKIVLGGNNGVATLLQVILDIKPSTTLFIISFSFLLVSIFFLDKKQTISIIYSSLIYPLLVEVTIPISKFISISNQDILLISIYIGLLSGITNGLIIKLGFNNGGINVIGSICYKYLRLSYSKTMFMINSLLITSSAVFLGIENILYAIIILYINRKVIDMVILNTSKYKVFEIIIDENKAINKCINTYFVKNYTKIRLKDNKMLIISVIKTKDYPLLKNKLKKLKCKALLLIKDGYDIKINN